MRIGILSLAHHHAEAYADCLRALPGVELLGFADEDMRRSRSFAERTGARRFPSEEALLAERPDGVIVTSENALHRRAVELAAAAGVSVLCEKPIATTTVDARAIVEACRKSGVTLMTAFPMRFSAPLRSVRSRLEAGDLGTPYCASASNQGALPKKYRDWFVDAKLAGGGCLVDHVVHLADLLRWYLRSEVVEVYARTNRIFHASEVDVETGGMVALTFDNGFFATIDCSWSRPDSWPAWGGLSFEIVTDRGALLVDAFRQNLTLYGRERPAPVWLPWGSDANLEMIGEFVAAIRERRDAAVTGEDGLAAVEIAAAAYESARTGLPARVARS